MPLRVRVTVSPLPPKAGSGGIFIRLYDGREVKATYLTICNLHDSEAMEIESGLQRFFDKVNVELK